MAKNRKAQDAAAKAKKQKILLGVMGVVLLGLGFVQGPKLMKQLNPPATEATPAAAATASAGAAPVTPAGTAAIVTTTPVSGPKAVLAGVIVRNSQPPARGSSQLRSFSLFDPKDPFVPQEEEVAPETVSPAAAASAPVPAAASGGTVGPGGAAGSAEAAPTDATITMNGSSYRLQVKKQFPKADPLFVLVSLKPKVAKIGVAGGAFVSGKTIALRLDRQVTLVNETTGARYTLKLVYTGVGPEQTESFTQAGK